jgi:hypothetical protein
MGCSLSQAARPPIYFGTIAPVLRMGPWGRSGVGVDARFAGEALSAGQDPGDGRRRTWFDKAHATVARAHATPVRAAHSADDLDPSVESWI